MNKCTALNNRTQFLKIIFSLFFFSINSFSYAQTGSREKIAALVITKNADLEGNNKTNTGPAISDDIFMANKIEIPAGTVFICGYGELKRSTSKARLWLMTKAQYLMMIQLA